MLTTKRLVWLNNADQQWNSIHDWTGLAGKFQLKVSTFSVRQREMSLLQMGQDNDWWRVLVKEDIDC